MYSSPLAATSLFVGQKILAGKLDQTRVTLSGDQAALNIKIASLGTLDELLEVKTELWQGLEELIVEPELSERLRNLVSKIRPLGQLYLAQKRDSSAHIQEVLASADQIQQQLSPIAEGRVTEPLRRLAEIYRRVQRQIEQEPSGDRFAVLYSNSLTGLTTGTLYITSEVAGKIIPLAEDGQVKKSLETGQSAVNFYGDIFWKANRFWEGNRTLDDNGEEIATSFSPFYEQASHLAGKIFFQLSSTATELAIVTRKIKSESVPYYVQGSSESKGIGMNKILQQYPDWVAKLDPLLVGRIAVLHMVLGPQDAKGDNSQGNVQKDSEGNVVKVSPQEIDSDLWGVRNILSYSPSESNPNPSHFINCRSFYFCLPHMYQRIPPQLRQQLRELLPASALVYWLYELRAANQRVSDAFRNGNIDLKMLQKMHIPLCLIKGMAGLIFKRLARMKLFAVSAPMEATLMDLFKAVVPELAHYYDIINEKHGRDPNAAFFEIFHKPPDYEVVMKDLLPHLMVDEKPLSEHLPQCQHTDFYDFVTDRDTPPEIATEQFFQEELDFRTLEEDDQSQLLKVLKDFPLNQLTLRNCLLTDDDMLSLMRSQRHLTKLTLIRCPNFTDNTLQAIATLKRHLELDIRECSGFSKELLGKLRGYFPKCVSSDRRQTVLVKTDSVLDSSSQVFDKDLLDLTSALDEPNPNWQRIRELASQLSSKGLEEQAITRIIEKLTTKDLMRQIVKENRGDVLEFLEKMTIQLSQKNSKGETFFHLCCQEGNVALLKILCQKYPGWRELVDLRENTLYHTAVQHGQISCLTYLIELKGPINKVNASFVTSLRMALEREDGKAVDLLLTAGAEITETHLRIACQKGMVDSVAQMLERAPHLIDKPDMNGKIPLVSAIESNQLKCFQLILDKMATADMANGKGMTPLMLAAQRDLDEMVRLLIAKGVKTQAVENEGLSALHLAALSGAENALKRLLAQPSAASLTSPLPDGKTLLHLATLSRNANCVSQVLSLPLSPTQKDSRNMTPAHYAAAAGDWPILSLLLDKGFSLKLDRGLPIENQENSEPETCLVLALRGHHFAATGLRSSNTAAALPISPGEEPAAGDKVDELKPKAHAVEEMLQRGASMATVNRRGWAPLHIFAKEGDVEVIRYLCEKHKINVNLPVQDSRKVTPLHLAASNGHLAAIDALIALGADPNAPDQDGKTPLHMAMQVGKEEVANRLVDHGADLMRTMKDGSTCLHYAVLYSHPRLVEFALSRRPGLIHSCTSADGKTLLHHAMSQARLPTRQMHAKEMKVLKILLWYGADVDARDDRDYVPLHLAARWGRKHFAAFLLNRGARVDLKNKPEEGDPKTPAEHAAFMAEKTPDADWKAAILEVKTLLEEHGRALGEKTLFTTFSHSKSLRSFLPRTLEEQTRRFLHLMSVDQGFRKETILFARGIEAQLENAGPFMQVYAKIFQQWNQSMLREVEAYQPTWNCEDLDLVNAKKIIEQFLKDTSPLMIEALTCIIPLVSSPAEILQSIKEALKSKTRPLSEPQLRALCALILHFKGHEALMATDFPSKICHEVEKKLKGANKEATHEAREFLDKPERAFPPSRIAEEWKQNSIPGRRQKLLGRFSELFDKDRPKGREELLEQLTLSLMSMNRDLLTQVKLRELRHLSIPPPHPTVNPSVYAELKHTANNLTGNCLIFLLMEKEKRLQRFEFVIDWMSRSVFYGDLHQAFAIYSAFAHPAVMRLTKLRKKLPPPALEQLLQCESLFSFSLQHRNYTSLLQQRLTPSIPAFAIFSRHLAEKTTLGARYATLLHFKEQQALAQRLRLPPAEPLADFLLFFTSDLFPQESAYKSEKAPEKPFTLPGEAFAWKRSLEIQRPSVLKQPK